MLKLECYSKLYEIKNKNNVNIDKYVRLLASNGVCNEVLLFINKYIPQQSFKTYNTIYEKRHKNPLYKNLVNENSSKSDKLIAISSLLTQCMIGLKDINNDEDKKSYIDAMNVNKILESLQESVNNDNDTLLNETFNDIRNNLKNLN